jgi:hypothetical protein
MNGMYGGFGGNMGMGMGMGMNDMSAMNMMNYNGGYGNGYNGMGSGYGNFGGPNQMGGYNQSGAYPEMMNQFPKNNFPNQNQNRFHANQGGAYPQRNRNGSHGSFGPGFQKAHSRPGSRSGPAQNVRRFHHQPSPRPTPSVGNSSISATDQFVPQQRDGQSPDGTATEAKAEPEPTAASAEATEEGKDNVDIDPASDEQTVAQEDATSSDNNKVADNNTNPTEHVSDDMAAGGGLNPIQTFDSGDGDTQEYDQSTMANGMQANIPYAQGMMNQFSAQQINAPFDPTMNMNMNMGYSQNNNFGSRGGFHNGAYGAARVLTGPPTEPVGVGVVGAPTGPRAMREGRPNTGFSSRMSSGRYVPPPKSVASTQDVAPGSPQRRVRS